MSIIAGIGLDKPVWFGSGFPWVATHSDPEYDVYDNIIFVESKLIRFSPNFWLYRTNTTSRAWRKALRDAINDLCGYPLANQSYHTSFWITFLGDRCSHRFGELILSNDNSYAKEYSQDRMIYLFEEFHSYIIYITGLSIRDQKTGNHKGYSEWLKIKT